jgi:hypothetical protein
MGELLKSPVMAIVGHPAVGKCASKHAYEVRIHHGVWFVGDGDGDGTLHILTDAG